MIQVTDCNSLSRELERFLVVAQTHQRETDRQAFMPACPVDTEWHRLLERPEEYQVFCRNAVGHDIRHGTRTGRGRDRLDGDV